MAPWKDLPNEILIMVMKECTIQDFVTLSCTDRNLRCIGQLLHHEIVHTILSRSIRAEVLPVASWCSRARHAIEAAQGISRVSYIASRAPANAHEFVLWFETYLEKLGKPSSKSKIEILDAIWMERLAEPISALCAKHLTIHARHFLCDSGRKPALLKSELAYVERAGFYVAAMIEASHAELKWYRSFVDTWKAIPNLLSQPELYQVRQFLEWLRVELQPFFTPLDDISKLQDPMTKMTFGAEFIFMKTFGMEAALNLKGDPANDARYSDAFFAGCIKMPEAFHHLCDVSSNPLDWRDDELPAPWKRAFFEYKDWYDHDEILEWYRDDPHSDVLFNYFCPGVIHVPSPRDATDGPCRLMLWSIDRIDRALWWRMEYYHQVQWKGIPHYTRNNEERYAKGLIEWIKHNGMEEDGAEAFLQSFVGV